MPVRAASNLAPAPQPRHAAYRLKITLREIDPPIWRHIEISGASTLLQLHRAIQIVMGWKDYHLFMFTIGGGRYGLPDPDGELEFLDAGIHTIADAVATDSTGFLYEYDFGDSWVHTVAVDAVTSAGEPPKRPVCLGGARACPPEDAGGPPGYANLVRVLADRADPEYPDLRRWAGRSFDPERFDLEAVNARLQRARGLGARARRPAHGEGTAAAAPDVVLRVVGEPLPLSPVGHDILGMFVARRLAAQGVPLAEADAGARVRATRQVEAEALIRGLHALLAEEGQGEGVTQ